MAVGETGMKQLRLCSIPHELSPSTSRGDLAGRDRLAPGVKRNSNRRRIAILNGPDRSLKAKRRVISRPSGERISNGWGAWEVKSQQSKPLRRASQLVSQSASPRSHASWTASNRFHILQDCDREGRFRVRVCLPAPRIPPKTGIWNPLPPFASPLRPRQDFCSTSGGGEDPFRRFSGTRSSDSRIRLGPERCGRDLQVPSDAINLGKIHSYHMVQRPEAHTDIRRTESRERNSQLRSCPIRSPLENGDLHSQVAFESVFGFLAFLSLDFGILFLSHEPRSPEKGVFPLLDQAGSPIFPAISTKAYPWTNRGTPGGPASAGAGEWAVNG